ncbi:hypothetical protein E0L36_10510 [Streptomyces sp. AJS327]|uniref:hypothetical protein n=1 Tax=Streptomyces sp. AJS327 TaxID=2545265 RepID=UPI0015DFC684|nr:hypothetical protein [Streptomyces sp. AJS327]MBA0051306.1 hypothetical protein [Streptomyces sp. AJS327]
MYERGTSSRTSYSGVEDAADFGFELNLGAADLGYTARFGENTEQIGDATYLGAPYQGKRKYVPFSLCAK